MKTDLLDDTKINVKGGDGGAGNQALHREKYNPYGGPGGGDGGKGGDLWLEATESVHSLNMFLTKVHFKAERGLHGQGSRKDGKDGADFTLHVPCGTEVRDPDTDELLADLVVPGQRFRAARGGLGGRGNSSLANNQNPLPRWAEKGEPGQERWIRLLLKMLADVGIVGFPNAGKSTLLSAITAAHPKVAPYPFTTLSPNLGMLQLAQGERAIVADIPGLIEGAHEGVGLGHKFLQHIERARLLVHLVDVHPTDGSDPLRNYDMLRKELRMYDVALAMRPEILLLNQVDKVAPDKVQEVKARFEERGSAPIPVSGLTGQGLEQFVERLAAMVPGLPPREQKFPMVIVPEEDFKSYRVVRKRKGRYRIQGLGVERMVIMADLDNDESLRYLQTQFKRMGIEDELRRQGATPGDTVAILELEFEYQE